MFFFQVEFVLNRGMYWVLGLPLGTGAVTGYWVATGNYQWALNPTSGHWVLLVGYWALPVGYWALLVGYWAQLVAYWALLLGHWAPLLGHKVPLLGH